MTTASKRCTMTTVEMITRVAQLTEYPEGHVHNIVYTTLSEICNELSSGGSVMLRWVGLLHWKPYGPYGTQPKAKLRLKFKPSISIRHPDERKVRPMEKYGVKFLKEHDKHATHDPQDPSLCRTCGQKLDTGKACPIHGTEPLEQPLDNETT